MAINENNEIETGQTQPETVRPANQLPPLLIILFFLF